MNDSIPEIPKLAEKGINVFKIFMGDTVGGVPAPGDGGILKALKLVSPSGWWKPLALRRREISCNMVV